MKKILKAHKYDIVVIGLLLVLILGWQFFYTLEDDSPPEAFAAEFDNLGNPFHGWAWNENIGWLSFNCENTDSCVASDYSVGAEDLNDLTARIAGCAWSEVVGWLCFDTPDDPPNFPATSTMLDLTTNELSGWARFCSLADDPVACSGGNGAGWVKMRCLDECAASNYGVSMTKDQSLHGQAYSDDYGWISFNCEEAGPSGQDWCATSSYHVAMNTNVSGYAYSTTTDWISFNCNNEAECGSSTYGVHLDYTTQTFAGYAWSDNVGWISFQESNPPDATVVTNNCDASCVPGAGCTACLDAGGVAHGWAKVLSYGDNGWMKLNDDGEGTITSNVWLNGSDFEGWAYNGSNDNTGIGWVVFNCNDAGGPGDICVSTGDFKVTYSEYFTYVFNDAPTTTDPVVFEYLTYCDRSVFERRLDWTFTDPDEPADGQTAYQIIIDRDNPGPQPPGSPDFDSGICLNQGDNDGKCASDGDWQYFWIDAINNSSLWNNFTLDYGSTFYWWIMVWDQSDEPSADWNVGESFTIDANEWPNPYFYWYPPVFSQGEDVAFISTTSARCYRDSFSQQVPCDNTHTWHWTTDAASNITENDTYDASSTVIRFSDQAVGIVHLELTDTSLSVSCSTSSIGIGANVRLPSWIETQ